MSAPACVGKHEIFDSTHWLDHYRARAICAECPLIQACRERLKQARELSVYGGDPEGTWAGELLGYRRNSRHLLIEEEMFSDADARAAHAAWNRGDRSHRAGIGERVYQRRIKREGDGGMSHESRSTVGVSASQVHGIGGARRYDEGYNKAAPGGASTPLIQGPRRSIEEID